MSRGLGTAIGTALVTVTVTLIAGAQSHFEPGVARNALSAAAVVLAGCCACAFAAIRRTP
jgi:hypothetical protein